MTVIASLRHPRVLEAVKLHHARGRREAGLMLLDGPNVVSAAIAAGIEIKTLFLLSGSTMSAPSTAADTYLSTSRS